MEETKIEKRSYSSFANISEVCEMFNYDFDNKPFVDKKTFVPNEYFLKNLIEDFEDNKNFTNEYAICESIIRPILSAVAKENSLPLWSHVKLEYKINDTLELSGEPDYLFAFGQRGHMAYSNPVVCLGEAKNGVFTTAWGQVGAEMVAAQKRNKNEKIPIYGLVSAGRVWEFGKLEGNLFSIPTISYSAPSHLNEIMDILNWILCEARKNATILENKN